MKVRFQRCSTNPDLPLPRRMTEGSSGLDLRACVDGEPVIPPGGRLLVPTGFRVAIPVGFEGQVRPRSGLAVRAGITLLNTPGTVDADYRGELGVLLINLGSEPCTLRRGDRIAQLVIAPVESVEAVESDDLPPTARGEGGFGHTGAR